jgi:hypothetical protein
MKILSTLVISLVTVLSINGQDVEWKTYKLDSLITIDLPEEVEQVDTFALGVGIRQVMSTTDNSIFIVQRTPFDQKLEDGTIPKMPTDLKSLDDQYKVIIEGVTSRIPDSLIVKDKINIGSLIAYELGFINEYNTPTFSGQLLYLNKDLYTFYHINKDKFTKSERTQFFDSININSDIITSQFSKQPHFLHKISPKLAVGFTVILAFIIFYFWPKKKNR